MDKYDYAAVELAEMILSIAETNPVMHEMLLHGLTEQLKEQRNSLAQDYIKLLIARLGSGVNNFLH